MKKPKLDGFLVGMAMAVGLAFLFPGPGSEGGFLHPEFVTKGGVALIFFLHGLALSFGALKAGAFRWRLHLVVQTCTFLLFPLLGLGVLGLLRRWISPDLGIGLFYLCALPSTVSSSVALTASARGNVPAAVFNATLSSLLGVFLTPLWIGLVVKAGGNAVPIGSVILDLVTWLLVPLAVGQLARPLLGSWAARNKAFINKVDRTTILLLVYTSFCDSVTLGIWTGQGVRDLAITLGVSVALLALVLTISGRVCDALGFPVEDRIAAVFCGSKKTLASGVPMAQLIFGASPGLGLILLPIMIYHPLQLVWCGVLAGRWGSRKDPEPSPASTPEVVAGEGS